MAYNVEAASGCHAPCARKEKRCRGFGGAIYLEQISTVALLSTLRVNQKLGGLPTETFSEGCDNVKCYSRRKVVALST